MCIRDSFPLTQASRRSHPPWPHQSATERGPLLLQTSRLREPRSTRSIQHVMLVPLLFTPSFLKRFISDFGRFEELAETFHEMQTQGVYRRAEHSDDDVQCLQKDKHEDPYDDTAEAAHRRLAQYLVGDVRHDDGCESDGDESGVGEEVAHPDHSLDRPTEASSNTRQDDAADDEEYADVRQPHRPPVHPELGDYHHRAGEDREQAALLHGVLVVALALAVHHADDEPDAHVDPADYQAHREHEGETLDAVERPLEDRFLGTDYVFLQLALLVQQPEPLIEPVPEELQVYDPEEYRPRAAHGQNEPDHVDHGLRSKLRVDYPAGDHDDDAVPDVADHHPEQYREEEREDDRRVDRAVARILREHI